MGSYDVQGVVVCTVPFIVIKVSLVSFAIEYPNKITSQLTFSHPFVIKVLN